MKFVREDPEGMLKASALDLVSPAIPDDPDGPTPYVSGYDYHKGWGFLQADKLFQMLDPAGPHAYQLKAVEVPHADLVIPSDWSTATSFKGQFFYSPNTDASTIPNPSNIPGVTYCDVLRREITTTFDYSDMDLGIVTDDPNAPVYVWGNTGSPANSTPAKRGLASELPNWEEPWCEVTSGLSANDVYGSSNNDSGAVGIINSTGTLVSLHTYQYELFVPGSNFTDLITSITNPFPSNDNLGLGFTVFGPSKNSSGVKEDNPTSTFSVWPSTATTEVMATLNGNEVARSLELVDAIGQTVYERSFSPEVHHLEFSVASIPSGLYIARVITADGERDAKIIVSH